jgi:hypothetical protein
MYNVQHALFTHNMTVMISRYANHPTQVEVEIEDHSRVGEGGNVTKMYFQLHHAHPVARQRCSIAEHPKRGNVTFEDSFLSYLGVRDQLRHWAISEIDGVRTADYYDYHNATGNRPHSVVYKPGQPGSTEMRFIEMDEHIDDAAVAAWLHAHFNGDENLYYMSNLFDCENDSKLMDTPAILGPFREVPDTVDWYTKDMLHTPVDRALDEQLAQTSMRKYWGGAMYLRKLLAEHSKDDCSEDDSSEFEDVNIQPEDVVSALSYDFNDPWFWREVGTQWGVTTTTSSRSVVQMIWSAIAPSFDEAGIEALRMQAAEQSGLEVEQLLAVPAPVQHIARGVVVPGDSDFSVVQLSFVLDSWNPSTFADDTSIYVVFGSGTACSDAVFKVTNSSSLSFTVDEVLEPDDILTENVDEETLTTVDDLSTTNALAGSLAFFHATYAEAVAASCDPTEALSSGSDSAEPIRSDVDEVDSDNIDETGRRRLESKSRGGRRRLTSDFERAFGWSGGRCTASAQSDKATGLAFLEEHFDLEVPSALQHLGSNDVFGSNIVCCGDHSQSWPPGWVQLHGRRFSGLFFCSKYISCDRGGSTCGIEVSTDLAHYPRFSSFSSYLGVESIHAELAVTSIPDREGALRLEAPTGSNRNCQTSPPSPPQWILGDAGLSCDEVCVNHGGCTDGRWGVVSTRSFGDALSTAGQARTLCETVYSGFTDDHNRAASSHPYPFVRTQHNDCLSAHSIGGQSLCDAKSDSTFRALCLCDGGLPQVTCETNKCNHDVREEMTLQFIGTEQYPWTRSGPSLRTSGSLKVIHDKCRSAHSGYSLADARRQVNTLKVIGDLHARIQAGHCEDGWTDLFYNLDVGVGIEVSAS